MLRIIHNGLKRVTDEAFQVLNPGLVNPENYSTVPGPVLEITNCQQCPHFKRERYFTGDSWEEAYNWFCKAKKDKKIAGYVEWNEADKIEIPNWCPIIKN